MDYASAKKIADRIVEIFTPHCEPDFIHIAGSVRREKYEVKDIEIVCIPKKEFIPTDLFGGGETFVIPSFLEAVNTVSREIIKGKPDGRYMQTFIKGFLTFKLDLFLPQKADYYRQLAIRTGSGDYSHKVIAEAWLKKGWCGTNDGLRKQMDCTLTRVGEKNVWKCMTQYPTLPPEWQSEEEFFQWLGIKWKEPKDREFIPYDYKKWQ